MQLRVWRLKEAARKIGYANPSVFGLLAVVLYVYLEMAENWVAGLKFLFLEFVYSAADHVRRVYRACRREWPPKKLAWYLVRVSAGREV